MVNINDGAARKTKTSQVNVALDQLCPTSGPRAAYGPFEGFVRPSLGFRCIKSILHTDTCPCFDNFELDFFDAGGPQCHFITSVTTAVGIRTLLVY